MADTTIPEKEDSKDLERGIFRFGKQFVAYVHLLTGFDITLVYRHLNVLRSIQSKLVSLAVLISIVALLAFFSGGLVLSELVFHVNHSYLEILQLIFIDSSQLDTRDYTYLFLSPVIITLIGTIWAFIILNLYRLVIIITMNIGQNEGIRKYGRILFGILFSIICGFMLSMPLLRIDFIEDITAYSQIQDRSELENNLKAIHDRHHDAIRNAYIDVYGDLPSDFPEDQIEAYMLKDTQEEKNVSQSNNQDAEILGTSQNMQNCSSQYLGNNLSKISTYIKSDILQCINKLNDSIAILQEASYVQKSETPPFLLRLKVLQMQNESLQADQLLAVFYQLHPPGLVQSAKIVFQAVPLISWTFVLFIIFMMLSPIFLKIFGPKSIYDYFIDEYNRIPLAEKGIELHRYDVVDRLGKEFGLIDRYYEYEELKETHKENYLRLLKKNKDQKFQEFQEKYHRLMVHFNAKDL
jgi:hypothetical protein